MPAASRPGISTSSIMVPPSPVASISRNAPVSGEPSRVAMAAKLPAAATTVWVRAGASRLASRTAKTPEPSAQGDQRGLGAEDHAQAQGREGGEHDAGQLDGAGARRPP